MRRILLPMMACACATGSTPEPQAAVDVRAQVQKTMGAFVAMDLEGFKAGLTEDVVAFEMDMEGRPVRLASRGDAGRYAQDMFAEVKKMGATLKLDVRSIDCRAAAAVAYCTVEFDLTATMADGKTMSQPSRNSIVLRKGDAGWAWAHWHSSLAVAPTTTP